MKSNILLNCLPPTNLYMPAIGCEVLKSYIDTKLGTKTEIIYWNHIFQDLYRDSDGQSNQFQPQNDLQQIFPFLGILAEQDGNNKIRDQILFRMQEAAPSFKTMGGKYYKKKYFELLAKTRKIIKRQLEKLLKEELLFFGISAKFDAWIPAMLLAHSAKQIRPDIKIVLGGIEEPDAAQALFNICQDFDYAIWGEGEIPRKMLIEDLMSEDNNLKSIPRFLFRNLKKESFNKDCSKTESINSYLNLTNYLDLDYSDYFKSATDIDRSKIQLPIEISRGCRWNKCNFCALNWGYRYRTQDFKNLIKQVRNQYNRYKIPRFFFVDNDVVGKNIRKFEKFLDDLIELSNELGVDFDFHADILHLNFNKNLIKKLSLAGFKSVQIGYEGVSDSMLRKLNKSTTFAENLLFIKFAQKYDVNVTITGLIIGIPNESESDIIESTENLHYLRFFLGEDTKKLQHRFAELSLFYKTNFWEMISSEERKDFNLHPVNDFLKSSFFENEHIRYSLLGQSRRPKLNEKWHAFKTISDHYEKSNYQYYLIDNDGVINYMEYKDSIKVDSLTFDNPAYWEVLRAANDVVISFSILHNIIQHKYPDITELQLNEIISDLKDNYLLYASDDNGKLVSIIDTDYL